MRFSFIVPTFDRAYILGDAIRSVLAQTAPEWELVVVDDGSTDDTGDLVASFGDARIRYLRQENRGAAAARNRGMEAAQGEWIAYLDSDNIIYPTYLETVAAAIAAHPGALWGFPCGTRTLELYEKGKLVRSIDRSDNFPATVTVRDIVHRRLHTDTTGAFHHRSVITDGVRFDETFPRMEDWDLFLTLAARYPERFLYVPTVLYDYHQRFGGDGLVSSASYREWAELFERIYQKHRGDPLMAGQEWYPERVNKWNRLADDFERGLIPPYHLWYFQGNDEQKNGAVPS